MALDLLDLLEQLAVEMVEALEELVHDEAEPLLSDRFVLVVLLGVLSGRAALLPCVAEPLLQGLEGLLVCNPSWASAISEGLVGFMGGLRAGFSAPRAHGAWLEKPLT